MLLQAINLWVSNQISAYMQHIFIYEVKEEGNRIIPETSQKKIGLHQIMFTSEHVLHFTATEVELDTDFPDVAVDGFGEDDVADMGEVSIVLCSVDDNDLPSSLENVTIKFALLSLYNNKCSYICNLGKVYLMPMQSAAISLSLCNLQGGHRGLSFAWWLLAGLQIFFSSRNLANLSRF